MLNASPYIARYIRSFVFCWHMASEPPNSPFKNKAETLRVLAKLITQLTSLQTFGWDSRYALPDQAFAALVNLTTIKSWHLDMGREKTNIRLCE